MGVIGSAELLVSSRLDPKFAADLKRQVAAAGAKVGAGGIPPVKIAAQLDLKTATSNLQKFGQLQARADNENLARAKKIADAKSRTARQEQADIQRLGNLQSRALRENALFDEKKLGASLTRGGNFFQRFQEKANASLGKVGLSVRSLALATGAGFLAGDILALGLRGLISVTGNAIKNFSNLTEAVSATSAVFGSATKPIDDLAKTSVKNLGLSSRAVRETANSLGLLIQNAGATESVAATLSAGLVRLAADVASLQNVTGGTEKVAQDFASALAGESEPVRKYGIDVRVAALEQIALKEGIIRTGQELTAQQKTYLTQIAIIDGTKKAYGNFLDTSDDLANSLRRSAAAGEEASAALGRSLQPAAISATQFVTGLKIALSEFLDAADAGAKRADKNRISTGDLILGPLFRKFRKRGEEAEKQFVKEIAAKEKFLEKERQLAVEQAKIREEDERSLKGRSDALRSRIKDDLGYQEAQLGTQRAVIGVEQAERKLDDARRNASRQILEIQAATIGAERATLGLAQAELTLAKTRLDNADIASGIDRQERQLDVTINLQEATLALVRAQNDQIRSQLQLQRLSLTSYDISLRLVNATRAQRFNIRELMSAQIDQREAALDLTESQLERGLGPNRTAKAGLDLQRAQREASRFNEVQTHREAESVLALKGAELALDSARLDIITSTNTLYDARLAQRDLDIEVRLAELDVAGAHLAVKGAIEQQASAFVTLKSNQALANGERLTEAEQMRLYISELGPSFRASQDLTTGALLSQVGAYEQLLAAHKNLYEQTPLTAATGPAGPLGPGVDKSMQAKTERFLEGIFGPWIRSVSEAVTGSFGLGGRQFGGPLPGIPGAQQGRKVRQESLIRIGEAGPEILAIRPGHRPEIIPNGGQVPGSGGRPINVQVNQVANDPEATAFAVATRLGSMVTA